MNMKKFFTLALLAACAFTASADYGLSIVEYRSRFLPSNLKNKIANAYKNTISVTLDSSLPPRNKEIILYCRAANKEDAMAVATIKFTNSTGKYTVTYNSTPAVPFDDFIRPVGGTATAGGTITLYDYFNVSTYADHFKGEEGGDTAGSYIYTLSETSNSVSVPVYASSIAVDYVNGYTFDEIMADTDHSLKPAGIYVSIPSPEGVAVDSWKIYRNTDLIANASSFTDEIVDFVHTYYGEMKIGDNTYGTDHRSVLPAMLDAEQSYNEKSAYTFVQNGDKCRYYKIGLTAYFDYEEQQGNYKSLPVPTIETGGYRAWRTCTDPAEEYSELLYRSNDFLAYDNVGYETGIDGADANQRSGIASNSEFGAVVNSTVKYLLRAYYYMKPYVPDPLGAPAHRVASVKEEENRLYYISEMEFEFLLDDTPDVIVTGVEDMGAKQVSSVKYYNVAGVESNEAFDGMNIVVTRYTDGTTSTSKVIR